MKAVLLLAYLLIRIPVIGQQGYVILKDGQKLEGYLKRYNSPVTLEAGIQCWKDKKDKTPIRIPLPNIYEYSLKKRTKRIIKDFKPFHDRNIYIDLAEADLISTGKVDLLQVSMDKINYSPFIYIIEDSLNYLTALPNTPKTNELYKTLLQLVPEDYLRKYFALHSNKIFYSDIPSLIYGYNSDRYYFQLKPDKFILLQAMKLIDHAAKIFEINYSEPLQKPDLILGDTWKKMHDSNAGEDTYHAFVTETGGILLATDKTGTIKTIQFFPKKNVRKEELDSFLKIAYDDKIAQYEKNKNTTFIIRSDKNTYAFSVAESAGLHYLVIVDLSAY